jgi:hypothetical protein
MRRNLSSCYLTRTKGITMVRLYQVLFTIVFSSLALSAQAATLTLFSSSGSSSGISDPWDLARETQTLTSSIIGLVETNSDGSNWTGMATINSDMDTMADARFCFIGAAGATVKISDGDGIVGTVGSINLEGSLLLSAGKSPLKFEVDSNGQPWGLGVSFEVAAVEVAAVPVPAAAWLFGSGLIGMAGVSRRARTA